MHSALRWCEHSYIYIFIHQVFGDDVPPKSGLGPWGEVRLLPDMESRCAVPWHPTHEMAIGNLEVSPGSPMLHIPQQIIN
jgi:hypothetical protein